MRGYNCELDELTGKCMRFSLLRASTQIRQHIIIHGNLTKKTKINIAGDTVDVEEYVDSNDKDSDVVNNGTKEFSNRHSFMVMKDRMQKNVSEGCCWRVAAASACPSGHA
eukprot:535265-Pelagomonas_calceolata.AAC.6